MGNDTQHAEVPYVSSAAQQLLDTQQGEREIPLRLGRHDGECLEI